MWGFCFYIVFHFDCSEAKWRNLNFWKEIPHFIPFRIGMT